MRLDLYANDGFDPGAGLIKRTLWYVVNALLFASWLVPMSRPKIAILRWFGASIGTGVVIKPRVNIKYPWKLSIGDFSWVGEGVWIDNLDRVDIGRNCCVSQGAYLLTGNHDYRSETFDLRTAPIRVEDSAWIGAFAVVCPGVLVAEETILAVGSVLQSASERGWVYRGNPAVKLRLRIAHRGNPSSGMRIAS